MSSSTPPVYPPQYYATNKEELDHLAVCARATVTPNAELGEALFLLDKARSRGAMQMYTDLDRVVQLLIRSKEMCDYDNSVRNALCNTLEKKAVVITPSATAKNGKPRYDFYKRNRRFSVHDDCDHNASEMDDW